jgi:predicted N-acyltransferase
LQRGFEPVATFANYHIRHPQFSNAIKDYLKQELQHIERYMTAARSQLPFKKFE